ncbi:MAG TPA: alanine racemase [Acidimicrobiales bacterium]|nr:alanine racemase [Acidimicrobiales bacterium]
MAAAWADVSLAAVAANVETLRALCTPAEVCAVVKADGYGHGAVPVARAAVEAGAAWLAVAQVTEATELRAAGLTVPILLLSEPRPGDLEEALAAAVALTVYTPELVGRLGAAARAGDAPVPLHLKVDTGMRRVGADPRDVVALATSIAEDPTLSLDAVWTHCAVADDPNDPFTAAQLERFDAVVARVEAAGLAVPMRHAANSAAAIAHPASRYDLVRCGIAVYGIPPAPGLANRLALEPAVRLATEVAFVKPVSVGEGISYGLRHRVAADTVVATLPIGYADGVFRALGTSGQEVLIGGRRHPMVGTVTMDQVMVDVGPGSGVRAGEEVVLLGAQGGERISPDEWAARLGTIAYEVVCALGPRVERRYVGP